MFSILVQQIGFNSAEFNSFEELHSIIVTSLSTLSPTLAARACVFSMIRIMRLFKLTRHSPGLKILEVLVSGARYPPDSGLQDSKYSRSSSQELEILLTLVSRTQNPPGPRLQDSRSSFRRSRRAPTNSPCSSSSSSLASSSSPRSSTTPSALSTTRTTISRPSRSDSGGQLSP